MSSSLQPHGLCSSWSSPGQNTGVSSLFLLQGIVPTQGLNPGLLHSKWILYQLSHRGSPRILEWVAYPFSIGSSQPRNWTGVSSIAGGFFTNWARREAPSCLYVSYFWGQVSTLRTLPPFFFTVPHSMWYLCSPTRDWTRVTSIRSAESEPLDRQESPPTFLSGPSGCHQGPGSRFIRHGVVSVRMSTAAGTVFSASPGLQQHSGHSL